MTSRSIAGGIAAAVTGSLVVVSVWIASRMRKQQHAREAAVRHQARVEQVIAEQLRQRV